MEKFLSIAQLVAAILLMALILIQQKSAGVTSVFGGEGAVSFQKRGPERIVHILTIIVAISFGLLSLVIVVR